MEPTGKDNRRPAFLGAAFTIHGACINHRDVLVCKPILTLNGSTQFQRLGTCPKCTQRVDCSRERCSRSTNDDNRSVYCKYKIKSHTKQVHPVESSRSFESSTAPFNTPFDTKGKCHYHKDVKLAIKQMGEWKVLVEACPMCREDAIARSTRSKPRHSKEYKYVPQYDEDGYCINHSEIRIAKKKVTGSWKVSCSNPHPQTSQELRMI